MYGSRRARQRTFVALAFATPVCAATAFAGCNEPEREPTQRYFYPPDANDEDATRSDAPEPVESGVDAGHDGDADASVDADAAAPLVRALATGSSDHPDGLIGGGDHTCVVAGAARNVYCWGANDHGQLGNGKSGAGAFTEDVAAATKIALDENGLPFDGIDEISMAGFHSCARKGADLYCWGQRISGAQAEPPAAANVDRTAPRAIGAFDVKRIGIGGPHSCALKTNGVIACFGHSSFNELGRPYADDPICTAPFFYDYQASTNHQCSGKLLEVMFGLLPGTAALAAGETHSCALAAGKVHCWGASADGELGRPNAGPSELNAQIVVTSPTALTALDGITAIANDGARHTCVLRTVAAVSGEVLCWGMNDANQLGVATATTPKRDYAVAVGGLAGITALGVAPRVTCVVKADTTVACWGNDLAALGDGGIASSPAPTSIKGPLGVGILKDVVAVAPGIRHVCVRKKDDSVWCWGKNDRGQLGDGTKNDSAYPVKVIGVP